MIKCYAILNQMYLYGFNKDLPYSPHVMDYIQNFPIAYTKFWRRNCGKSFLWRWEPYDLCDLCDEYSM